VGMGGVRMGMGMGVGMGLGLGVSRAFTNGWGGTRRIWMTLMTCYDRIDLAWGLAVLALI
jgi:hypothetical protein